MDSASSQIICKFESGSVQPGFDRPGGALHDFGNFFVEQTLFMKQGEDQLVIGAETGNRSINLARQIVRVVQTRSVVRCVLADLGNGKTLRSGREERPTPIGGDPQQPGTDRPINIEAIDCLKGAKERFLGHVLGVLSLPQHSVAKALNHCTKSSNEEAICLGMTGPNRLDQCPIVHRFNRALAMETGRPVDRVILKYL